MKVYLNQVTTIDGTSLNANYNRENEQHSNSGLGLAKFPV